MDTSQPVTERGRSPAGYSQDRDLRRARRAGCSCASESDDGCVGWGEASLEGHTEATQGAFAEIRDRFLGYDSARIEDMWQTFHRLGFYRAGRC